MANRKGFTIVEIMVVIFIIGILIAALTPRLSQAQLNSSIDKTEADLRVYAMDFNNYIVDYGGVYIRDCLTLSSAELEENSKDLMENLNAYMTFSVKDTPDKIDNSGGTKCRVEVEAQNKQDPWGNKYRILMDTAHSIIIVTSPGPDAKFSIDTYADGDFGDDIIVIVEPK